MRTPAKGGAGGEVLEWEERGDYRTEARGVGLCCSGATGG